MIFNLSSGEVIHIGAAVTLTVVGIEGDLVLLGVETLEGESLGHEGKVEARSLGPAKGSEFIVRLSVSTTSVPSRQEPSCDGEKSRVGPKRRILIADPVGTLWTAWR
jgi:hypothetical protein